MDLRFAIGGGFRVNGLDLILPAAVSDKVASLKVELFKCLASYWWTTIVTAIFMHRCWWQILRNMGVCGALDQKSGSEQGSARIERYDGL
jgi:membrane associated rhomboid family serine protease